ncbi:MAG: bifunctional [glutamate--ammonia ligase]-adenylyl-L-tyrosine phosphorylase/[glutamate--ammonia-ligase] adenylyltransferase [Pseudomonadota bacterium]
MDSKKIDLVFPNLESEHIRTIENRLDTIFESLKSQGISIDIKTGLKLGTDLEADLIKAVFFSEYIASSINRNPAFLKDLIDSKDLFNTYSSVAYEKKIKSRLAGLTHVNEIKTMLLQVKSYETIRIAWRDLTGKAGLEETLEDLSCLADAIVQTTINSIYDQVSMTHGLPLDRDGNAQGIIVLAMGKLGARELNFSSDIDLIFVYPKDGDTNGDQSITNGEFFTKVCRKFLKFFSPGSHETNFYRIDTRLRPFGDGGPLVMSKAAFEEYYQAQGREWERYAMIKARPVAGDIEAGFRVLKNLNSFIYRRYFDYGSFDSFREMKHRIARQVKNKKLKNNIKLGAGGIREIEFFGQLFQLIRGGVEPKLQELKILKVLDLLQIHRCVDETTKNDLKQAYVFLRQVENRLQAYGDCQTHDIPQKKEHRAVLSISMGYDSWNDFVNALDAHMDRVHYHFNQLLLIDEKEKSDKVLEALKELWININDPQFAAETIDIGNFKEPGKVLEILRSFESHPNTKQLTPNGQKKLARLIPLLVKKIGEQTSPDEILVKLIDLIITIERRTCYLSLLIENTSALDTLITLAHKSGWIITFLSGHPALLDELMQPATLYSPPGKEALEQEMADRMSGITSKDLEFLLEELCVFRQVNMLRVAAADISGNYPLMKVSDHLTYIAEIVLTQVLCIAWDIVTIKYGFPEELSDHELSGQGVSGPELYRQGIENCGFAIVAYGKVGGFEMGYKSDIDIVFLHKGGSKPTQGTNKSIDTTRFYSNLGQRIIHALTVHTPAGTLYGADMRLRPGGAAGMIVSHIDSFEAYMENEAWTWEHQALIRARPVAGDRTVCSQFEKIRKNLLTKKRDPLILKKEVCEMREKMRAQHLKAAKGQVDLKQSKGGIVDIEFLVQYLILKHAWANPDITAWTDNIRLLESLDVQGLISAQQSEQLQKAYIVMRQAIHHLNLQEKTLEISEDLFKENRRQVTNLYDQFLG